MIQEWVGLLKNNLLGALPEISTGWIALLSGLFGAVITAIFNYLINIKLAKREQRRKEQSMAYVYLVKVSDIVATDLAFRKYISWEVKRRDPDSTFLNFQAKLKSMSEKLDVAHGACVLLAKALNEDNSFWSKIRDNFRSLSESEKYFEEALRFRLPDELLVQLPRESVIHYQLFIKNILAIDQAINLWVRWAKTGENNLLTANTLYSHWTAIRDISTNAHQLRDVLIKKGKVSPLEAENILNLQQTKLSEGIRDIMYAKQVMEILGEMYKKTEEKKLPQPSIGENNIESSPTLTPPAPKTQKPG